MSKDKPKCCKIMFHNWQKDTCSRSGVVVRDGKHYCKQHDPKAVEARIRARNEKWDMERRERNRLEAEAAKARSDRESCHTACLAAGLSPSALAADPEAIKRLVETVAKLPKTADGVPVTPGMEVHAAFKSTGHAVCRALMFLPGKPHHPIAKCYSTKEAALRAIGKEQE